MAEKLKVLLVEDVARDAELIVHALRRAGFDCQSRRVETEPDYREALDDFRPDIVVSDYSLPQFNGMAALAIARESPNDLPLIFVSCTIGEDVAVEAMKSGANDYVMKTDLTRLGPA